jgi:hypothetical protein
MTNRHIKDTARIRIGSKLKTTVPSASHTFRFVRSAYEILDKSIMLRDLAVFRPATLRNEPAMFEVSLICEIEVGAIRGALPPLMIFRGHEKFLL